MGAVGRSAVRVARAFARAGASVFLAGRTEASLEEAAEDIRAAGGRAETAVVDALDEEAVDRHADEVAAKAGSIDISFNLITHPHTHGVPFHEMGVHDFMAPVEVAARTTFITARAAARHMIPRGSGVILAFGGPGERSGHCATTTSVARRSPSTRSRRFGANSPSSSVHTESGSSPWRAGACRRRSPTASTGPTRSRR